MTVAMQVGFYTVFRKDPQHYVLAERLIASVRRVMPGVGIVQFTDETSPDIHGVDEVRRKPHGRMLERRLEHYAETDDGGWLLLDTDVVVQCDVRSVFAGALDAERRFDIALADRHWPHMPATPELTRAMPFNTGVAFSRSPAFWREALATWRALPGGVQDWLSEQRAVAQVVRTGHYRVRILEGTVYNYPPNAPDDPGIAAAAIVHYKGNRKGWMLRPRQESPACV